VPALHVRNVPQPLYEKLRERAAREGRSINGEAIAILDEALSRPSPKEGRALMARVFRGRKPGLFSRFTEQGRQVVVWAQEEARSLKHEHIGTEHLLLGVFRVPGGLAAQILAQLGVDYDDLRGRVVALLGEGTLPASSTIPFTPAAKQAFELALREAAALGHGYIGTEHLLLGILRQPEGTGVTLLRERGVDAATVRAAVAAATGAAPLEDDEVAPAWEYRVEELAEPLEESLRRLPPDWELVSVADGRAVLKRRAA
jgi:plasmid stability protein